MAIIFVCIASLFLAIGNLLMRKSLDSGGTTKTYLVLQLSFCFFVSIFLGPVKSTSYSINGPIVFLGLFTGFVLIGLLSTLGKALEKGPPGITFSILSAGAVFPAIVMAAVFGEAHGFPYTPWQAAGSLFVIGGLFWAGKEVPSNESQLTFSQSKSSWISFVILMFGLHILLLLIYQSKSLIQSSIDLPPLTYWCSARDMNNEWFVPMMYLSAMTIQIIIFCRTEWRIPNTKEWTYGFAGGISNALCTFFLLYATNLATGLENVIIFPVYSIATIVFSNLWSQRLYGEKVNWRACQVCAIGIFLGSVDWKVTLSTLGW